MKCCFCGPVRNCGPYLNKIFENIEKLGTLFDEYQIVIYYDNSEDDTLKTFNIYEYKSFKF